MENYYFLSWKEEQKSSTSAFAPKGTKLAHDLISELRDVHKLPFELHLVKLDTDEKGLIISNDLSDVKEVWLDYQPNSLAWPIMSSKMKNLIESNLKGNENVDWIECTIKNKEEERIYFILRFNTVLDVLDFQQTSFVQDTDHIIRPVFSSSKIGAYTIFPKPASYNFWQITSGIFVSESLKKTMQKAKVTGIDFSKARIA